MNIIVGEIIYQHDGYYVVLVVDNPSQVDISIVVKTVDDLLTTSVDILKLPTRVVVRMQSNDQLYYQISGQDPVEISVNLSSKRISNIFTYGSNYPKADVKNSLLSTMFEDINACIGRTMTIGIGNNVYTDDAWINSIMYPQMTVDNYIRKYRKTLFKSSHRNVLCGANSNLFLCDTHDIVGDTTITQSAMIDQNVTDAAISVYNKFLEAAHFNIIQSIDKGWVKYYDDLLIVTFERVSNGRPSIDDMIERINQLLTPDIKNIIVITGWACIPSPRDNISGKLYRKTCPLYKFMSDDDLYILYNYFLSLSSNYGIVLVGGGLRFGSKFTVSRGVTQFDIIISNPITNQPDSNSQLAATALNGQTIEINNITIFNITAKAKRCYGRILNSHPLSATLVYGE